MNINCYMQNHIDTSADGGFHLFASCDVAIILFLIGPHTQPRHDIRHFEEFPKRRSNSY